MRRSIIAVILAAAAVVIGLVSQATADPGTLKVKGTFENQVFSGAGCTSPVDLCIKGTFKGSLKGPDETAVSSLTPTQTPEVVLGHALLTIHDKRGDVTCDEQFVYNVSPASDGHFAFLCEITSGTGRYAGAT